MPLKERLRAKSSRSSLSPFFQMLIVIHVGYHIASCMKGNFTNTLLFRETESQNTIMLYNIFLFFAECVGMTVAAPHTAGMMSVTALVYTPMTPMARSSPPCRATPATA